MKTKLLSTLILLVATLSATAQSSDEIQFVERDYDIHDDNNTETLFANAQPFDEILFVERTQYAPDHHNTETLFQLNEIAPEKFCGGSFLKILNLKTGAERTILTSTDGVIRDPELSFDGKTVIFSWRKNRDDFYHIYQINIDGKDLKQLTFAKNVSDIDPLYLPDGGIVFSSTREPKYCMCNRHVMCNLYRMDSDGANITQIGHSTLFEGHSALLNDGRIIYDRWEYVDRNFADAQALWTVNPDGTKHAIYYGNNTQSPDGVIDPRAIPNSDMIVAILGACHDRPWGALALIDRKQGVDDALPIVETWPSHAKSWVGSEFGCDKFKEVKLPYEDPFPIDENNFLVSHAIRWDTVIKDFKMGIFMVTRGAGQKLIKEGNLSLFDPQPIMPRFKPPVIPFAREFGQKPGFYYVQNVYEGTNMKGVEAGTIKYLRVIESPEKRTWAYRGWGGQGEQAPAMNWHSFENKKILGDVPVAEDGSAYFEVPAGRYVYFQLLDGDKKMVQSMRSGSVALSGETNGCIGCHENRLSIPIPRGNVPMALKKRPAKMEGWNGQTQEFSYAQIVQPIFDKHCLRCHDFDASDRGKLVLAGDRNPFFNASYVNLYVKGAVKLIGGGAAAIQEPKSWGSHASKLAKVIDSDHNGIKLAVDEKQTIYTWLDLNGVYYPFYEAYYESNLAGRSPLTDQETKELGDLCGIDFFALNGHGRSATAQISFERPAVSPCLDNVRTDKAKYKRALEIIALGGKRMKENPRADMAGFQPCERHMAQLENYARLLEAEQKNNTAIEQGTKNYDNR